MILSMKIQEAKIYCKWRISVKTLFITITQFVYKNINILFDMKIRVLQHVDLLIFLFTILYFILKLISEKLEEQLFPKQVNIQLYHVA